MDPTEGCLAGGENYREEGLPPPAPLPPTRRVLSSVSMQPQGILLEGRVQASYSQEDHR